MAVRRPIVVGNAPNSFEELPTGDTIPAGTSPPAGSDTQVQFNDGGVTGADAGLTFNKTTKSLSATASAYDSAVRLEPGYSGGSGSQVWFAVPDWSGALQFRADDSPYFNFSVDRLYVNNNEAWHAGNLLDIGTSAGSARTALSLGAGGTDAWTSAQTAPGFTASASGVSMELGTGGSLGIIGTSSAHNVTVIRGGSGVGSFTATGLNSCAVGATTPNTGAFTSLSATGLSVAGAISTTASITAGAGFTVSEGTVRLNTTSANASARNFAIGQLTAFGTIDFKIGTALGSDAGVGTTIMSYSATGLNVTGGILSSAATSGIGYGAGAGAGGTVTQATSKTTGVTLNKVCGVITMSNTSMTDQSTATFTLTNSAISGTDLLVMNHPGGGTLGNYEFSARCASGSASICVRNVSGATLGDAVQIRFAVIKGSIT